MRLLSQNEDEIFSTFSDGSVYGQKCATSAISVAAMDIAVCCGLVAAIVSLILLVVERSHTFSTFQPSFHRFLWIF